jgi:hypothetical protein
MLQRLRPAARTLHNVHVMQHISTLCYPCSHWRLGLTCRHCCVKERTSAPDVAVVPATYAHKLPMAGCCCCCCCYSAGLQLLSPINKTSCTSSACSGLEKAIDCPLSSTSMVKQFRVLPVAASCPSEGRLQEISNQHYAERLALMVTFAVNEGAGEEADKCTECRCALSCR